MNIYWLERVLGEVPADDDWLSTRELLRLREFRFPKRRDDWRLGRWTAKQALGLFFGFPVHPRVLRKMELVSSSSGAPEVAVRGFPATVSISLSHRNGRAACCLVGCRSEIGCDLEVVEPRSDAFVSDYFTDEERKLIARAPAADRSRLVALLWSAKESALKALRTGLRLDTRSVSVNLSDPVRNVNHWGSLQVHHATRVFRGWWRCAGGTVRTVVADPWPNPPICLESPLNSSANPEALLNRRRWGICNMEDGAWVA